LFGVFNDPVFGLSKSSIYSQFTLSTTDLRFPDGAVMDSMVLQLVYDDYYGKPNQTLGLKVYELTESISADESYYNTSSVSAGSAPIGNISFIPDLTDTISDDSTGYEPRVRIKLDQAFADKIFNQAPFSDNDEFVEFFKGFHIAPDTSSLPASGDGAIVEFYL